MRFAALVLVLVSVPTLADVVKLNGVDADVKITKRIGGGAEGTLQADVEIPVGSVKLPLKAKSKVTWLEKSGTLSGAERLGGEVTFTVGGQPYKLPPESSVRLWEDGTPSLLTFAFGSKATVKVAGVEVEAIDIAFDAKGTPLVVRTAAATTKLTIDGSEQKLKRATPLYVSADLSSASLVKPAGTK